MNEFKKNTKMINNSVLARQPFTLVLVNLRLIVIPKMIHLYLFCLTGDLESLNWFIYVLDDFFQTKIYYEYGSLFLFAE